MTKVFLDIFVLFNIISVKSNVFDWDNEFENSMFLDFEKTFELYWNIINDTFIDIGISCKTLGWCGIGISPNGGMGNSDFMIGWVDNNGNVNLEDRNLIGIGYNTEPVLDESQDLILISGAQQNGRTRIRFKRSLVPCDTDGDLPIELKGSTKFIYAMGGTDTFGYHLSNRGAQSVNIITGSKYNVPLPSEYNVTDAISVNLTIPSASTTYCSVYFELPAKPSKQHIIRLAPHVFDGNHEYVHHMVLYWCDPNTVDKTLFDAPKTECSSIRQCDTILYAWAVGGDEFVWPEEAGMPFSSDPNDPQRTQYLRLEMHYDNPQQLTGIRDHSGITIYYTDQLRQYDGGLMEIGRNVDDTHFIPNGIDTTNYGYCGSACSSKFGVDNINAIASFLHTHTIGYAIKLRHFRNNTELEPIDENPNYDFDFQQMVPINKTIKPGDSFLLECSYNSNTRERTTFGGLSTHNEMCLAFLAVYPVPSVNKCLSTKSNRNGTNNNEHPAAKWFADASANNMIPDSINDPIKLDMTKAGAIELYNSYAIDLSNKYYETIQICEGPSITNTYESLNINTFFEFTQYNETIPECNQISESIPAPSPEPTIEPTLSPSTSNTNPDSSDVKKPHIRILLYSLMLLFLIHFI